MKKPELTKKGQFFDYSTLIIVFVLLAFGLVMIYSTSSYSAAAAYGDSAFYFKKQLMATLLGLAAMMIMSFVPYQNIQICRPCLCDYDFDRFPCKNRSWP